MKVIKSLFSLLLLCTAPSLLGMELVLGLTKCSAVAGASESSIVAPRMTATVQATQKELFETASDIVGKIRSDIEQSQQKSGLIRQVAQASSQFQDNFLAFTRLLQLSIVNKVYDLAAIKSHLTFYKFLHELPSVLMPAEQQFVVDLLGLLTDKSGAYQGITPANQQRVINLLTNYYYTFCNDPNDFKEKIGRLASKHGSCLPLLADGRKLSYRYIPDAEKMHREFEKYTGRFEDHPFNKQLFKIIDCLEKNDIAGARKLQKEFAEANRDNLRLNKDQRDTIMPVSVQQRAAYEEGCKLAKKLEQIIDAHVGIEKQETRPKKAESFDDQFVKFEEARKSQERKIAELKKTAASLKKLIPQAKPLIDLSLREIEKRSANSFMYEQVLNYLSIIAHDASCDDTLCLLEGTPVSREFCRYESIILEKILEYVQDVNNPALNVQKAELRHNLFQLIQMWNHGRKWPAEYKAVIESFYAHCTKDKQKLSAETTDNLQEQKGSESDPQLSRSKSTPANLVNFATLEADYNQKQLVSEQEKTTRLDIASVDIVKTGRETIESRDNHSLVEKSVLEGRMTADARGDKTAAHPRAQEIIHEAALKTKERQSQLEKYESTEPDEVTQAKLEQRIELGMQEFREQAKELHTRGEVWDLFNGIMDCVEEEFKSVFPDPSCLVGRQLCQTLELPTVVSEWSAKDLLNAGRIVAVKNLISAKNAVTFIPHTLYSATKVGYNWLTGKEQVGSASSQPAQGPLNSHQQKELAAKLVVDQVLEAPSTIGMWLYGGQAVRLGAQAVKSLRQISATGAQTLFSGLGSKINPLVLGLRTHLARLNIVKPGFIQLPGFGKTLSWAEFIPTLQKLETEFGKEIMDMALKISKLSEKSIGNRVNAIEDLTELARNLKKIHSNPRWKEFLFDAAKNFDFNRGTVQEALAGIACEEQRLTGILMRSKNDGEEFIERCGGILKEWDVKAAYSYAVENPARYIFDCKKFIQNNIKLRLDRYRPDLIIDVSYLNQEDFSSLLDGVGIALPTRDLSRIIIVDSLIPSRSLSSSQLIVKLSAGV